MREPADARDSTRYFVWTPFRSGNEIGEVFDAERGSDYNEHGIFGREPDRGKVTRQLDWQIGALHLAATRRWTGPAYTACIHRAESRLQFAKRCCRRHRDD